MFKSHKVLRIGLKQFRSAMVWFGLFLGGIHPSLWIVIVGAGLPPSITAASAVSQTCDQAATQAAHETGVPRDVLMAITRTETGRARSGVLQPWPWTVNMEGTGKWFDDEDSARSYVFSHFKAGARSFDVGCFQINYRWHGQAFRSIDEMFEPVANAVYAAKFLKQLHSEIGNWTDAAGAYHSRTPKYANRYKERYERILATVSDIPLPITPKVVPVLQSRRPGMASPATSGVDNSYPLLQAGSSTPRGGSLVPLSHDNSRTPFFTNLGG